MQNVLAVRSDGRKWSVSLLAVGTGVAENLSIRARHTACARPSRTRSTRSCSRSLKSQRPRLQR